MDLINGRSRELATAPVLVFTAPYSGDEILLINNDTNPPLGIVYHPLKMDVPIAWMTNCPHCQRGQQLGLDIALKRAVQILCSRQVQKDSELYQIPTNDVPCSAVCRTDGAKIIVTLNQADQPPVKAVWNGRQFITHGSYTLLRSKIVDRALRLISSARTISTRETLACLKPLLVAQKRDGIANHRRHPCLKLDWAAIADRL
jgi:hypothetical protein